MIELRVLGSIDLRSPTGDDPSVVLGQPKLLALLVFLAAASGPGLIRRDHLVVLFWPELDGSRARAALRSALHELRAALGADVVLTRGNEEVGIDPSRLQCDVRAFQGAIEAHAFEEAARLYRGPLLPAFFIRHAPEFERWLEETREALAMAHRRALERLAAAAAAGGDRNAALRWWSELATADPLNATAARELVRAFLAIGDRSGGTAAAERHVAQLREADIAPEPSFLTLVQQVRSGAIAAPAHPLAQLAPAEAPLLAAVTSLDLSRGPRRRVAPALSAALVAVALLAAAVWWVQSRPTQPPARVIERLAILPLRPTSTDAGQLVLATGLTEEIIGAVTRAGLRVIAYASVKGYPDGEPGMQQAARTLKVDAVATGTLTVTDSGLTIALEVVDPATHEARLAFNETVRRDEVALLATRTAIRLVTGIHAGVLPQDRDRLTSTRPVNPLAYGAYLRGRSVFWEGDDRAQAEFRRAVAIDTTFAAGYAALGEAVVIRDYLSPADASVATTFAVADAAIHRALRLDPNLAAGHRALGALMSARDFDWIGAEREFRRAIDLEPSPLTFVMYGLMLNRLGRDRDAAILFLQAALANPSSGSAKKAVAWNLVAAGDTAGALREAARQLAVDSTHTAVAEMFIEIAAARGQLPEALEAANRWGRLSGRAPEANLYRAAFLGRMGHSREARAILPRVNRDWLRGYPYLAIAATDTATGFALMDSLAAQHRPFEFLSATGFAPEILTNARFRAVLARYGVDPSGNNGLNDGWVARRFDRPPTPPATDVP